ncbi:unnamed protein product [Didymodactylos carnosus]|uniref:Dynein light intermediate chain n=1 Tax=Didymodactylos carnosus TaxID=1234261 RepID=A0A8S2EP78_9BILA|nr:unnamed protein product [Didymodactylos carnosus]CAF4007724.1 unnamed protein product [Didymodactylos carnosus]
MLVCLCSDGASLIYTSVKEKKNIDKLYKYIVHKCYNYPFHYPAAVIERDSIFIPNGWDNEKKTDILLENLHKIKPMDNYSDIFSKPVIRRPLQRDTEIITAEDDQEFLTKLQSTLNRTASPARTEDNTHTPLMPSRATAGTIGSQSSNSVPNSRRVAGPSTPNTSNEGALAVFFNGLLTRKSVPGTPTTPRQKSNSISKFGKLNIEQGSKEKQNIQSNDGSPSRSQSPSLEQSETDRSYQEQNDDIAQNSSGGQARTSP